jgi:hypothetical protein
MPMRLLTMPTSQDWHVVIIDGPLAIRHRRAAKTRKIAMDIIADRAPLGAKPTSGSAARGRGFGEELPNNPEEREATIAESVVGTFETCRPTLTMSVSEGRPEVADGGQNDAIDPGCVKTRLSQGRAELFSQ